MRWAAPALVGALPDRALALVNTSDAALRARLHTMGVQVVGARALLKDIAAVRGTVKPTTSGSAFAVPPIYSIYRRNLGILHHHRIPFPACIRSSKSSRTARRSTQKSLPCDSRYLS